MQPTSITIERTFFLGSASKAQFPESIRCAISWSLENETVEEAEEKAIAKLYEMADRERKRRYKYIKQQSEQRQKEQVQAAAASSASAGTSSGQEA